MKITATMLEDSTYAIKLSGAPAGAVAEVRMQNSMNGIVKVTTVSVDGSGNSVIEAPSDFGQHTIFSARVLDESNNDVLHPFTYTKESTGKVLVAESTLVAAAAHE